LSFLRRKAACPHCGRDVKEPRDAHDFLCPNCHRPGPWATAEQAAIWQTQEDAKGRFHELLQALINGGDATSIVPQASAAAAASGLSDQELQGIRLDAFEAWAGTAIADDLITPEENSRLAILLPALGTSWDVVATANPGLRDRVFIASVNGGLLPEVASPQLMSKKGEVIHLEWPASLMKEVAIREYKGGYSGFSFPVGKTGIRYKVGGSRGQSVQVGSRLDVADTGTLAITNKRVVYMGSRKTVNMPYSALDNLNVYSDGLQFHLSNRVNAPLFSIASGSEMVAAVVHAAAQRVTATTGKEGE
jgi:hypothetical protein